MFGLITYSSILFALFVSTWRRPAVGIGAVLCLYGLKQWGQSSTALLSEYRQFTNYAVFIICVIGVVRAARQRSCLFCTVPPAALLVLALYAYAFLTIAWAPDPRTSLDQWIASAPYLVTITLLAPLLLTRLDDARAAFIATALSGAALCVLALAFGHWGNRGLELFGHGVEDELNIYRYQTNPLALSTMAGTVFLICALSLGRPNRWPMRLFAMACIPVALAVVLKSGSRGQLIASGVALFAALPIAFRLKDGRSLATLALIAIVVLGLGWWGASLVDVDASRWSDARTSQDIAGRFTMARTLLGASTSDFFTAIFGLGNSSAFQVLGIYPHITGLEVLAEEGIFGAAIYLAILLLAFRSVKRLVKLPLRDQERQAAAILAGLFIFELILSWKQGSLLFSVYVFAYAIALGRLEESQHELSSTPQQTAISVYRFQNLMR